jgi:hypothetical protein
MIYSPTTSNYKMLPVDEIDIVILVHTTNIAGMKP